jgi:hypothetical protein
MTEIKRVLLQFLNMEIGGGGGILEEIETCSVSR